MSKVKQLEKKLKYCEQNLKKAMDELWRLKKPKPKSKVNKEISDAIRNIHKIEDKIEKNKDIINRKKVNEMKRRALIDRKKFDFDNPFVKLPPIKKGGKKKKSKKSKKSKK